MGGGLLKIEDNVKKIKLEESNEDEKRLSRREEKKKKGTGKKVKKIKEEVKKEGFDP